MEVEREGDTPQTIGKSLIGFRDRYSVEVAGGDELQVRGHILDHEYKIERDGRAIATVSKHWFAFRDSYGIEIAPGVDGPLILAVAVCSTRCPTTRAATTDGPAHAGLPTGRREPDVLEDSTG